jgi:hypothetical protein
MLRYPYEMDDAERKLKQAIHRRTRAWADVYRMQPDGPQLIRSLLLGVENGVRRRLGTLPEHERRGPPEAIRRAFVQGQKLAEEIPLALIDLYGKYAAARGPGYPSRRRDLAI